MTAGLELAELAPPAFPLYPPAAWFEELPAWFEPGHDNVAVQLDGPEAGRLAATVAPRNQCILDGSDDCWTAPFSPTAYGAAHQGDTRTAEGGIIKTANLCCGVNHARLSASFREVARRAENTGTKIARVRYYDLDDYIVALGALWPDVTETQVAIARSSALSGDWRWRPELGDYDMAESIFVNTPGFPLMRAAALGAPGDLELAFLGGMGGVGPIDPDEELETGTCPHCAALAGRVEDLERIIAGLGADQRAGEIADMLEQTLTAAASLPRLSTRVGALDDNLAEHGVRLEELEQALATIVAAVGRQPRRLRVDRVTDRDDPLYGTVTAIVEETT